MNTPQTHVNAPAVELPQYQCHKVVRAAKITGFRQNGEPDMPDILLGEIGGIVTILPDWHAKHKPQVGGYYVVYEDGYVSYSPAKAFEDGYKLIEPGQPEPVITKRELAFALNCRSVDATLNTADHVLAEEFFRNIESNRGVHPSLGGPALT